MGEPTVISTILVPTTGTLGDASLFQTVLAVAKPLSAHIEFYHLVFSTSEAMMRTPHADFCLGDAATTSTFTEAKHHEDTLSADAREHFKAFCIANHIEVAVEPSGIAGITANYLQETDHPRVRLLEHARHSDLVILARPGADTLLPTDVLEMILMKSGRPIIIAPEAMPTAAIKTIVVGWQETPQAARSLGAAMPLLKQAEEVVLVCVTTDERQATIDLEQITRQLAWHGVAAKTQLILGEPKEARMYLSREIVERQADLLVVGGYRHGPWRESLFGGVTASIVDHAKCPVFMMH
jgi:nucleotide-binding universal stress UspA family protein